MLIKEVCSLTGLTKKAISYYEKQGLIEVRKGNNGYREYSKEDVASLNKISLGKFFSILIILFCAIERSYLFIVPPKTPIHYCIIFFISFKNSSSYLNIKKCPPDIFIKLDRKSVV